MQLKFTVGLLNSFFLLKKFPLHNSSSRGSVHHMFFLLEELYHLYLLIEEIFLCLFIDLHLISLILSSSHWQIPGILL